MKKYILWIFVAFTFNQINAQNDVPETNDNKVKIHLTNGTILKVEILDWDMEKGMNVITSWNQEMFIHHSVIKKVVQIDKVKESQRLVDNRVYYQLKAGLITGNNGQRASEKNGYTAQFSMGYRWNRWLSLGGGVGLDQYIYGSGEKLVPIFAEYSAFLFPAHSSITFNLQTGYALAFANVNKNIEAARGGLFVHPSLGLSFGRADYKYSFDIGYKIQNAKWTYVQPWDTRFKSEQNVCYKRMVLRFGLLF